MSYASDQTLSYLQQQIANASPAQQMVMLFDGAIKFVGRAREAILAGDIQDRHNNNRRAMEIVGYLLDVLDPSKGEVVLRLQRIYVFLLRRLSDVDFKNDPRICEEVAEHLKTLRGSWVQLAEAEAAAKAAVITNLAPRPGEPEQAPPVRRDAVA